MITHEELKALLSYDPNIGEFTRLVSAGGKVKGSIAGGPDKHGYILIQIKGSSYKAHRLAWLYCFNEWPADVIDHINRNKSDNRLDNLREATSSDNQKNRGLNINNTSGFKGVNWCKRSNKFKARICLNSVSKHLGLFATAEEASAAYEAAAKLNNGEFYSTK